MYGEYTEIAWNEHSVFQLHFMEKSGMVDPGVFLLISLCLLWLEAWSKSSKVVVSNGHLNSIAVWLVLLWTVTYSAHVNFASTT